MESSLSYVDTWHLTWLGNELSWVTITVNLLYDCVDLCFWDQLNKVLRATMVECVKRVLYSYRIFM